MPELKTPPDVPVVGEFTPVLKAENDGATTSPQPAAQEPEPEGAYERACRAVIALRKRPLLVLFYPDLGGSMAETDVEECYQVLRDGGVVYEKPLKNCDVLIHTTGGNPVAGYRLAQCIRSFAENVAFLVPFHAYSAGTLLCCSGEDIGLGHCAGLSPIDITMIEEGAAGRQEVELASLDSYLDFSEVCQNRMQRVLTSNQVTGISSVGSDLLCEMVQQVSALKVGQFYRARTLTGHYAMELLDRYMLKGKANSKGLRDKIINNLLFAKPAHEFHLDHHLCAQVGLAVRTMSTAESDATKLAVHVFSELVDGGDICQPIDDYQRQPFIGYFPLTKPQGGAT